MDRTLSRERENLCIQEQPPACTAACPVHVNVRGMIAALAKQDFAEGYAQYVRTIPFPGIISRICDAPCEKQCKRGEVGDAVERALYAQRVSDAIDRGRADIAAGRYVEGIEAAKAAVADMRAKSTKAATTAFRMRFGRASSPSEITVNRRPGFHP